MNHHIKLNLNTIITKYLNKKVIIVFFIPNIPNLIKYVLRWHINNENITSYFYLK